MFVCSFDTQYADLIFEKQFLSLTTKEPTFNVYGLGENLHRNFKHQFKEAETWAMFARDQPPGQASSKVIFYSLCSCFLKTVKVVLAARLPVKKNNDQFRELSFQEGFKQLHARFAWLELVWRGPVNPYFDNFLNALIN